MDEAEFKKIKLFPCENCGRKFNQDSLEKHTYACQKITSKPRKVFDSGRQRAAGSDVNYSKTKETKKVQILGEKPDIGPPKSHWREKHNEFIKSVRQARNITEAIRTGGPVPKFEPSAVPSDYVNCQFCNRNFSQTAAERHIPFCEIQSKRQKINNSANQQKVKQKFQAPLPNQRKQSSENYGHSQQENGYNSGYNNNNNNNHFQNQKAYSSGSLNKGYNSSGNDRKPIKYEANNYYETNNHETGAYSMKNKAILANAGKTKQQLQQEQILRTGRNTTNSELNALARNRSGGQLNGQKDSPLNSRDPSIKRVAAQNGNARGGGGNGYGRGQQNEYVSSANAAKFCRECGYEFPVDWARFCSYCGDRRS